MNQRRGAFRRPLGAVVLIMALVMAVAACGGGGSDGNDDGPEARVMEVGEVHIFDIGEMEGCDPDENGVIVCLHVDQEVRYDHTPPVGGMHASVFQDCELYEEPIFNEGAVHSLEHGAVWITFDPDLAEDQVELIGLLAQDPKVLASPWDLDDLPAPIVLSAWGVQLPVAELPDEAALRFVADHAGGPGAPKPDAPCTDGYDGTRADP
jgi:hypothetical protein